MKILIADDEAYVRIELRALLEELIPSAEISEVENGTELREILGRENFRMAFLDIRMPGSSGLDVLEGLENRKSETIFIILSGYTDFEYARKAISLDVAEYMVKPVTEKDLLGLMKRVLPTIGLHHSDEGEAPRLIKDAEKIIYKRYKEVVGVAQIAEELKVSPNYLSSQFSKYRNRTLTSYITELRMKTAAEMLLLPGANIRYISEHLGYQSSRHFARLFREHYGCSPSEFQNRL